MLADSYQGEPLDCIGGVINDLTADSKGGVYFTMGGVYYADPERCRHEVWQHHAERDRAECRREDAVRDQRPGDRGVRRSAGWLADQSAGVCEARGPGGGDGSTIDKDGRLYVTTNAGVQVLGPDGKHLGTIPTPRGVITAAFGGKDKKMLYILARGATDANGTEVANAAQVWAIQMIAQGYKGRAK